MCVCVCVCVGMLFFDNIVICCVIVRVYILLILFQSSIPVTLGRVKTMVPASIRASRTRVSV